MRVCPPAPQVQGLEAKVEQLSASLAEMGGGSGPGHIGKAIARSMGKRAVQPATLITASLTMVTLTVAKCTRYSSLPTRSLTPHPSPVTRHPSPVTPSPLTPGEWRVRPSQPVDRVVPVAAHSDEESDQ